MRESHGRPWKHFGINEGSFKSGDKALTIQATTTQLRNKPKSRPFKEMICWHEVTMEIGFKLFFNTLECGSHMDILKSEFNDVQNISGMAFSVAIHDFISFGGSFNKEEETTLKANDVLTVSANNMQNKVSTPELGCEQFISK